MLAPAEEVRHTTSPTDLCRDGPLVDQVLAQPLDQFNLLLCGEPCYGLLDEVAHAGLVHSNEARIVHEDEEAHDKLTVHAIRHTSMTWDGVSEILDFEGTLEAGCEEATKGSNERRKCRKYQDVEVDRPDVERHGDMGPCWRSEEEVVCVMEEDGVRSAVQAAVKVRAKILR